MAHRRWRRLRQLTRIILADLDFIRTNQRPWDVTGLPTRRLRRWLQPAGWLYQIIQSKILNYFWSSNYFRALAGHSSIGLDDNSMMLLGGRIGSTYQTGIWKIKENVWSRIGELTQVEILSYFDLFVISECRLWISVLHCAINLLFRWEQIALSKSPNWFDGGWRDERSRPDWESRKRLLLLSSPRDNK